ncbi:MAG: hypothetical protein V6Z86_05425 [Hyphomicrobiales bacterium]
MATRKRTSRPGGQGTGSGSGDGGDKKPPEEDNVTSLKFGSPKPAEAGNPNTDRAPEEILKELYLVTENLQIAFASPPDVYYRMVAPLLRSYGIDWRLQEVNSCQVPNGDYMVTYTIGLQVGEKLIPAYDRISVSMPYCDPALMRSVADRGFMRSFLKIAELPELRPSQVQATQPRPTVVNFEPPQDDEPTAIVDGQEPITVEYDTTMQPVFTAHTDDDMVLAETTLFVLKVLAQYVDNDCTNVDQLQHVWDKNAELMQRIKQVDPVTARTIGKMFGDKNRALSSGT